jgi:hypothetical protein
LDNCRGLFSLLVIAALAGCTAGVQVGTSGTGGMTESAGSMASAGSTGSTGIGGHMRIGIGGSSAPSPDGGNCGLQTFNPNPANADILLVLDRSASMQDDPNGGSTKPSKWDIVVPTLNAVISSTASSIFWGMKSFPEGSGSACAAGSVTSNIDTPIAPNNGTAVTTAITATTPDGNGTPTGDAINAAVAYLKTLTDTNPKYILLATDGEPSCAQTPTSEDTASAKTYAVAAVGIATTKASDTATLNAMADAGGETPASASNPFGPHFYLANDMTTLTSELQQITGQVSTCLFKLSSPPPVPNDPTRLGVYLNGGATKIPYDSGMANGWAYTDTSDTAVQVYGPACDMIQAAGAAAVQIIFGCPDVPVPG